MRFLMTVVCLLYITTASLSAFTQGPWSPNYNFTSKTYLQAVGDDTIDFTQIVTYDTITTPPTKFGNVSMLFRVDTHYVDFKFTDGSMTTLMSSLTTTYGLSANGVLLAAQPYGAAGAGPAGNVSPVNGMPGVYDVNIAFSKTTPTFTFPSTNLLVGGDGNPLKIIVHTNAISLLPSRSYRFSASGNGGCIIGLPGPSRMAGHTPATFSGGVFNIVPEPNAFLTLLSGIMGFGSVCLLQKSRKG